MQHEHSIAPIFDAASSILILGSFPSVRSRAVSFYYAHPQNRFWRVLSTLYGEPVPESIGEKCDFLHRHHLALWDVIQSCTIEGSDDASIRNVTPNDLTPILQTANLRLLITNGKTAGKLYDRLLLPQTQRPAVCLPSTSPANAACSFERLLDAWAILRQADLP